MRNIIKHIYNLLCSGSQRDQLAQATTKAEQEAQTLIEIVQLCLGEWEDEHNEGLYWMSYYEPGKTYVSTSDPNWWSEPVLVQITQLGDKYLYQIMKPRIGVFEYDCTLFLDPRKVRKWKKIPSTEKPR